MHLVMFDIDGTITATTAVDSRCFVQAVAEVLNFTDIDTNWASYRNVTDPGIAAEIIENRTGRPATAEELSSILHRFLHLMQREESKTSESFQAIPGASEMLTELAARPNVAIALATGAWRESALLKLTRAGLDLRGIPIATGSDASSREEIMTLALKRAFSTSGKASFDSAAYVGDEIWDLHAARKLGYHFIGVGTGDRASRLKKEGAIFLVPDFSDPRQFFSILDALHEAE